MTSSAPVLDGSASDRFILRAVWKKPTEELLAQQGQRFSHRVSKILSEELFPRETRPWSDDPWAFLDSLPSDITQTGRREEPPFGAREMEMKIRRYAKGHHVPRFYTLEGHEECDDLISKIMAALDPERQAISATLESGSSEEELKDRITRFGNAFRLKLDEMRQQGLTGSTYGTFVTSRKSQVVDPTVQLDHLSPSERYRPDILLLGSDTELDDQRWYDWPKLASFIEVNRRALYDCSERDASLLQSLRYTIMLLQCSLLRSHIHFVTWCGPLVRLWYVDAAQFGCSPAYSINDDLMDIGRIFYLLTSSECRHIVTARWDPTEQAPQELLRDHVLTDCTGPFKPFFTRSGLFGSSTTLWSTDKAGPSPNRRVFLKSSWRAPHLLTHELEMQDALKHLSHTPRPLGHVALPPSAAGFKEKTSDIDDSLRPLVLTTLMYEHRLGRYVSRSDKETCLTQLHRQFAEQLLDYSRAGLHYRDLNPGNFLIEFETADVLVLADHGNMRHSLKPRDSSSKDIALQDILDTARDDIRAANPLFLPSAASKATSAFSHWDHCLRFAVEDKCIEIAGIPIRDLVVERVKIMRNSLRDILVNSHRYIDDLESAAYLQLWQVAHKSRLSEKEEKELAKWMSDGWEKDHIWTYVSRWYWELRQYCPGTSWTWIKAMEDLRNIIADAQDEVREKISTAFDEALPLERLTSEVKQIFRSDSNDVPLQKIVLGLLSKDVRDVLKYESLMPIEEECFLAYIDKLEEATRKLTLEEETGEKRVVEKWDPKK